MENYVRFENAASPLPSRANSIRPDGGLIHDHDDGESGSASDPPSPLPAQPQSRTCSTSWLTAATVSLWRKLMPPSPTPYESQYLTLIPLSDARLKPRRTKLIVSSLLLLAVAAVVCVFLMVPRGVSIGSIDVHSTRMTFNSTTLTYRIILQADVPVYNPNYLKVSVVGNVTVSFFNAEAGWSPVGPVTLAARLEPSVLSVKVDASNLPRKYTQVVYTHCFNFPRKLIFFLLGNFNATYLGHEIHLPKIDTYFMLDCSGAKQLKRNNTAAAAAAAAAGAAAGEGGAVQGVHALQQPAQQHLQLQQQQQQYMQGIDPGEWGGAAVAAVLPEEMHDWELEVQGTVPTHGSHSSSSSSSSWQAFGLQQWWQQHRRLWR